MQENYSVLENSDFIEEVLDMGKISTGYSPDREELCQVLEMVDSSENMQEILEDVREGKSLEEIWKGAETGERIEKLRENHFLKFRGVEPTVELTWLGEKYLVEKERLCYSLQ